MNHFNSLKFINTSKNLDISNNQQKPFHIRRRKTFLIEQKPNIYHKESQKRCAISSFNTFHNQRMSFQKGRRSSVHLSRRDFRTIEEGIKNTILEMRRSCLWEIRRQSHDVFNIFEQKNNNNQNEVRKNQNNDNFQILESLSDNKEENKLKKSNTYDNIKIKLKSKDNKNVNKEKYLNIYKNIDINKYVKDMIEDNYYEQKKFVSSKILIKIRNAKKKNYHEKFRFLSSGGVIIDSNNENESEEEPVPNGYLINPESKFIFIYDAFITLATLYFLIYVPIELAFNFCFCTTSNNILNILINSFFDVLFIIDLFIEFIRPFYTKEEEKLVQNNCKIIINYIQGWFYIDLLTSLPINILFFYFCKKYSNKICYSYQKNNIIDFLALIRCLKALKVFKISTRKKNQFVTQIEEKCLDYEILDDFLDIFSKISFIIIGLHTMSCIHIFIGRHVYPGWIFKNNFENSSFLNLYMISLYYLTTTMTTVGYGEIQSDSFIEIIFRIILLAVGIICYSWLISSISNGINKQSYASINYSNECALLENIRRGHRELPYKIYLEIKKHIEYKHFCQKIFDKDLLINSLPYTLKNNLIFSMYKSPIEHFHFFKGISNTNFLVETLSYFTPITGKKNDILLKENSIIEEMYFVQEGRLALEVPINMDNPEESTNKYLSDEFLSFAFEFDYEANYNQIPQISTIGASNIMDSDIHSFVHTQRKQSFFNYLNPKKKDKKKKENNLYLKIHDIHKDEDFGDIYMFFGKRSPFALRVKTKKVSLYIIKKDNFANLYEEYHNVFRRIHKKKKHNYKIIKNILIKTISKFCDAKGIKIKELYKEKINKAIKSLQKKIIPIEILKNATGKNQINEIDEEINKTIKEFEYQIQVSSINPKKKKKIIGNIIRHNTSTNDNIKFNKNKCNLYNTANIKGTMINTGYKNVFLEDFKLANNSNNVNITDMENNLNFTKRGKSNIYINKNKKDKRKKLKTIIKSNILSNMDLKGINFDFTESEDSIQTVKIYDKNNNDNNNQSFDSGPKTINILPQSLINLLKTKINYQQIFNHNHKESSSINDQFFISMNNNNNKINNSNFNNITNNINNNIKNENSSNINSNIKSKNMSSSGITFDKMFKKKGLFNYSKNKSHRDTLAPNTLNIYKNKDNNNKKNCYTQYNNYQRCSITNNNILLKFDENLLKKNKNNSFNEDSLSSTSADSFQINRSYKNINQLTEGDFIKEKKFQKDIIKYIKDYRKHKDNKTNKNKMLKRNSSMDIAKIIRKGTNIFGIEHNIKTVKTRVSNYLNEKIKYIQKKTMHIKRKSSLMRKLETKKTKKDGSSNNFSVNSSIYSINNNTNIINKNMKNIENTIEKLNNHNTIEENIINEDS